MSLRKDFLSHFDLDTLRDLPDGEALKAAGLPSKDKLLAGDIMLAFAGEGRNPKLGRQGSYVRVNT
jgi:hypothetical protein